MIIVKCRNDAGTMCGCNCYKVECETCHDLTICPSCQEERANAWVRECLECEKSHIALASYARAADKVAHLLVAVPFAPTTVVVVDENPHERDSEPVDTTPITRVEGVTSGTVYNLVEYFDDYVNEVRNNVGADYYYRHELAILCDVLGDFADPVAIPVEYRNEPGQYEKFDNYIRAAAAAWCGVEESRYA